MSLVRWRAGSFLTYRPRITRSTATALAAAATRSSKKHATGLGMLVSVLLICSCGRSNSAAPTQAQFASQANAVCAVALRSAARLKTPKSVTELLLFSERAGSIVSKVVGELKGVTPPPNSRVAYNRFLMVSAHEARILGELAHALRIASPARTRVALQALKSNAVNEAAKALGIKECARTVTPG